MWKGLILFAVGLNTLQGALSDQQVNYGTIDVCSVRNNYAANDACALKSAFGGSSVFPKIFPAFQPVGALYVQCGNIVVGGAQQLSPSRIYAQPQLRLSLVDSLAITLGINLSLGSQKYIGACVDFQKETGANKLIWLQTGFQASVQTGILSSSTKPTIPYASPDPLPNSGTHEYVYIVFKETSSVGGLLGGLLGQVGTTLGLGGLISGVISLEILTSKLKLSNSLVAASYFKSQYDGQPINGYKAGTLKSSGQPYGTQATPSSVNSQKSPSANDPQKAPSASIPQQSPEVQRATAVSNTSAHISLTNSVTPSVQTTTKANSLQAQNTIGQKPISPVTTQTGKTPLPAPPTLPTSVVPIQHNFGDLCDIDNDAAADGCSMSSAFSGSLITPNIVPTFKPLGALYAQYGNVVIGGAQQMTPSRVQKQPTLKFSVGVSGYKTTGKNFFLLLVDTVAKNSKVSVSWAQAGFKISEDNESLVLPTTQPSLRKYTSPNPKIGSEARNYIFLLFEQPSGFVLPSQYLTLLGSINSSNHDSVTIDLPAFILATGLGSPIGGSFFKSTNSHSGSYRRSHRESIRLQQI